MISQKSHASETNHFKLVIVWAFLEYLISQYTLPDGRQQSRFSTMCSVLLVSNRLSKYMVISVSDGTHSLADPGGFVESWRFGWLGYLLSRLASCEII